MKNKKPNSFLADGLSIDETKLSVLMISYIICFIVTLWFFVQSKDGEGLKSMFFSTIAAITGVNITNSLSNAFYKNDQNNNDDYPKG